MADAIILFPAKGAASFTVDPSNSSITATDRLRKALLGPPTNGGKAEASYWLIQAYGTQTDANSVTAAQYRFQENVPYNAASPTSYSYVGLGT